MQKLLKTPLLKNKFVFWFYPEDKYVGQRVAVDKYEPYLTELMLRQIKEGDTVLDIGANIGYDTVLFADKVGRKGKVYAIEPDPENFAILQKNIKENGFHNVVAVQAAVGAVNQKMKMYKSSENLADHRMYESKEERESEDVFCRRLDDLMENLEAGKIDFIKIDVQGYEALALTGGKEVIEKNKPTIFLEYWPWGIKQSGGNCRQLTEELRKIYKTIYWVDEYIQVYFGVSQNWLNKKYPENDEINYGNLLVKAEMNWQDRLGQVKDFWLKKWLKRKLGKPLT